MTNDQFKRVIERKKPIVLVFSKLNLKLNILFVSFLRYLDTRQCFEIEINEKILHIFQAFQVKSILQGLFS